MKDVDSQVTVVCASIVLGSALTGITNRRESPLELCFVLLAFAREVVISARGLWA